MAEAVTIDGRQYLKRNPLGVLGPTIITPEIYGLYPFHKVNGELRHLDVQGHRNRGGPATSMPGSTAMPSGPQPPPPVPRG